MMPMRRVRELFQDRRIFAWALYDWGNSAFATTVIAGFFPIFFKEYWNDGVEEVVSTARLAFASSIASVVLLLGAPLLGALADAGNARKRFLGVFTGLGVVMCGALWLVPQGAWLWAAAIYVLASVGFSGAIVFYDALIVQVSPARRYDEVSAFGFSLGYIGGGLLFAVNVAMTQWPEAFGLRGQADAVRLSFVTVAVWWLTFSIPLFRAVPEARVAAFAGRASAGVVRMSMTALRTLVRTFRDFRAHRMAWLFLLAYFFYIDGVHTIIRMAVDYGLSLGLPSGSLIAALLITQFVGFPAALVFGLVAARVGPKPPLYFGVAVYVGVTVYAYFLTNVVEFYVLAAVIGLVQGGVQALSRSLYARFVPAEKSGAFFGLFNMLGRFAAVIGPPLVGVTGLVTGSSRLGVLSIAVVLVIGAVLLSFVRESPPATAAATS